MLNSSPITPVLPVILFNKAPANNQQNALSLGYQQVLARMTNILTFLQDINLLPASHTKRQTASWKMRRRSAGVRLTINPELDVEITFEDGAPKWISYLRFELAGKRRRVTDKAHFTVSASATYDFETYLQTNTFVPPRNGDVYKPGDQISIKAW